MRERRRRGKERLLLQGRGTEAHCQCQGHSPPFSPMGGPIAVVVHSPLKALPSKTAALLAMCCTYTTESTFVRGWGRRRREGGRERERPSVA